MFMFRMIIYLYELKHAKKPETLVDTLSYFFLLPNYCFMHFPVVDYRTMQRGYFADDVHAIQRRGLEMMFRGTIHLLCYRLVYHELLIPASKRSRPGQPWVPTSSAITCSISRSRASSTWPAACSTCSAFSSRRRTTTTCWRRASPTTGGGSTSTGKTSWSGSSSIRSCSGSSGGRSPLALAVATVAVFLATWFLHAYQSYWLRGSWGFTVPDALFWGILGALVLVNVQLDARRSRVARAGHGPSAGPLRDLAVRSLKVAGTFTTIALLWSLWSSPSLSAWLDMIHRGIYGS